MDFWLRFSGWLYGQEHLIFIENSVHIILKTELLLVVLPNFERETALGDSAFLIGIMFD